MKSGVKTDTVVCNRRNHGTNNNYVLFIIETKKMFPLEVTDPRNWECWRIVTSIHSVFLPVQCLWYIINISKVIPAEKRSHPRIITPIMSSEAWKQFSLQSVAERRNVFFFCFLIARESNQDIGQSSFFPSEGWKRKNILKNVIKGISMVGKYKATLSAQD